MEHVRWTIPIKKKWFSIAMVPESLIIFDYLTIWLFQSPLAASSNQADSLWEASWAEGCEIRRAGPEITCQAGDQAILAIFGGMKIHKVCHKELFWLFWCVHHGTYWSYWMVRCGYRTYSRRWTWTHQGQSRHGSCRSPDPGSVCALSPKLGLEKTLYQISSSHLLL